MKLDFFTVVNILVWFAVSVFPVTAQPNWEFLPQNYEYSMTITGRVNTDGYFSADENDIVGVFVNDECRGVTKLKYEYPQNAFYAYLFIYGNVPGEKLTFKIFDASENLVLATKDTLNFVINSIIGSPDNPVVFSSNLLNNKAELKSFSVPRQIGSTKFQNNHATLNINSDSLKGIAANFTTSANAKVYANGQEQLSGETENNFTEPVIYTVISEDYNDTIVYTIQIEVKQNDPPTNIILSNTLIGTATTINTIVATLTAEDLDEGDSHEFALVDGDGNNDSENHLFTINKNNLILKDELNYEDQDVLNIRLSATDSEGAVIIQNLEIMVTTHNPPKFLSTPPTQILQDETFYYSIEVSSDSNAQVDLIIDGLPGWLTYNTNSGTISGIAKNENVGNYSFIIMANDGTMESVQPVEFTVINANDMPVANHPVENQYFLSNRENEIHLPSNYFFDPDINDSLTFSLEMQDNSDLPAWLSFDSQLMTIRGTPPEGYPEDLVLKFTATDKVGLEQSLNFKIVIRIPTAVDQLNDNKIFKCYPNPVKNRLFITTPISEKNAQINLINGEGKLIKSMMIYTGIQNEISFEEMPPGIYLVRYRNDKNIRTKKIIKK